MSKEVILKRFSRNAPIKGAGREGMVGAYIAVGLDEMIPQASASGPNEKRQSSKDTTGSAAQLILHNFIPNSVLG
jgi:hypothetical protein